jgi:hypothetical protein
MLVGVDVVDGGSHPDDDAILDRDDHMVAWIRQELARKGGIDLVIEHVVGDVVEDLDIVPTEKPDFYHGSKQS